MNPTPNQWTRCLGDGDLTLRFETIWRRITGFNDLLYKGSWSLLANSDFKNADIVHAFNLHGHYFSLPAVVPISRKKPFIWSPVDLWPITGGCAYSSGCFHYLSGCGWCPNVKVIYPELSRDTTRLMFKLKRMIYRKSRIHFLLHTDWLHGRFREVLGEQAWIQKLTYGIDPDEFYPVDKIVAHRRFGMATNSDIFYVGLFHSYLMDERKGLLKLVRRLGQRLNESARPIHLLVAGHQAEEFKALVVKHFPLEVILTGYLMEEDLRLAYGAIDVLAFPTKEENMALTAINAMACAVTVISSRAGGQVELITDGKDGFLVPVDNIDAMIDKIFWLANNPEVCRKIGTEARRTIVERFNIHRYVEVLEGLYFQLYNSGSIKKNHGPDS
jgi:glycosyltransferase involved in cell wall biosynthesis